MELECRRETVKYWEPVFCGTAEQEEQTEMIVPDVCPDAGQILCSCPRLLLQRKQAEDGRMEFSGLIRVYVLYRPENESSVAAMEAAIPFALSPEAPSVTRGCVLRVLPRILSADVHLINSRKVLIRAVYQLEIEAFREQTQEVVSLVEDSESCGIRQKTDTLRRCLTVDMGEKRFSCQDTLSIPATEQEASELLTVQADCTCSEARILGDKVMIKGEAVLRLLCRGEEGGLFTSVFRLPLSQIMETGENSGEGVCQAALLITDVKCTLDAEDRRSIRAELILEAVNEITKTVEIPVLADLYSTAYELETERRPFAGSALLDRGEAEETVRVPLEGAVGEGNCAFLQVLPGRTGQRGEEGDLLLTQELWISALWLGENGPAGLQRTETAVHRLSPPGSGSCRFVVNLPEAPVSAAGGEGLEVSVSLRFRWLLQGQERQDLICRIALGERREAVQERPSLVVRAVRPGQTLWDLAKGYDSAEEDILSVNGLTSDELYPGQILLIPRRAPAAAY